MPQTRLHDKLPYKKTIHKNIQTIGLYRFCTQIAENLFSTLWYLFSTKNLNYLLKFQPVSHIYFAVERALE